MRRALVAALVSLSAYGGAPAIASGGIDVTAAYQASCQARRNAPPPAVPAALAERVGAACRPRPLAGMAFADEASGWSCVVYRSVSRGMRPVAPADPPSTAAFDALFPGAAPFGGTSDGWSARRYVVLFGDEGRAAALSREAFLARAPRLVDPAAAGELANLVMDLAELDAGCEAVVHESETGWRFSETMFSHNGRDYYKGELAVARDGRVTVIGRPAFVGAKSY